MLNLYVVSRAGSFLRHAVHMLSLFEYYNICGFIVIQDLSSLWLHLFFYQVWGSKNPQQKFYDRKLGTWGSSALVLVIRWQTCCKVAVKQLRLCSKLWPNVNLSTDDVDEGPFSNELRSKVWKEQERTLQRIYIQQLNIKTENREQVFLK